jgi:hypothetical protein
MTLPSSASSSRLITLRPFLVAHHLELPEGSEAHPLPPSPLSRTLELLALRIGPVPTLGSLIDLTKEHSDICRYRTRDSSTQHLHRLSKAFDPLDCSDEAMAIGAWMANAFGDATPGARLQAPFEPRRLPLFSSQPKCKPARFQGKRSTPPRPPRPPQCPVWRRSGSPQLLFLKLRDHLCFHNSPPFSFISSAQLAGEFDDLPDIIMVGVKSERHFLPHPRRTPLICQRYRLAKR